jgi:predicted amidohydrolase YtcJ
VRNARAIAVEEGRIIAVGSDREIKRSAPRGCEKVDLGGRPVFPGFTDSHTHFIGMGVDSLGVDLSETKSLDEALGLMRKAAEKTPSGGWIVGTGWSENRWRDVRFITRKDLDGCCPKHPAVAHRICGHLSSVNSRAIDEMKLDAKTSDVEVSADGELTGVLRESAVVLAWSATKPSEALKTRGLLAATKKAHSLGVTSIHDNGQMEDLRIYQAAESKGKLGVRVRFNFPSEHLDSILDLGLAGNFGSEMLRLGGVKIFCDGALGARTAALSQPFADDPGNKGMFVHKRKDLDELVSMANDAEIQIVMHAIGDAGIGTAISSIAAALKSSHRKDHRHRIEHLELPWVEHLTSMRRLGIVASMQPNFVGEWGASMACTMRGSARKGQ